MLYQSKAGSRREELADGVGSRRRWFVAVLGLGFRAVSGNENANAMASNVERHSQDPKLRCCSGEEWRSEGEKLKSERVKEERKWSVKQNKCW